MSEEKNIFLDEKGRIISGVFIYTGFLSKGMTPKKFVKTHNIGYVQGGHYVTVEKFFGDCPIAEKKKDRLASFDRSKSKLTNAAYRGPQFIKDEESGRMVYLYYISLHRMDQFSHIKNTLDSDLVFHLLKRRGFEEIYSGKRFLEKSDTDSDNYTIYLYYHKIRNILVKVDTDGFVGTYTNAYTPIAEYPTKIIFTKANMTGLEWDREFIQELFRLPKTVPDDTSKQIDEIMDIINTNA